MIEEKDQYITANGGEGPALWSRSTLLSVVITVAVLVFLASYVDLTQVWREVAASDKRFLFLAALWHYGTYPVRGTRWRRSLKHVSGQCGNARFGLLVFFFMFVDNVVPAKLGDIYAAHLARINCGVRRSAALGSIVFLRMVDAWVVLILAAAASWYLFSSSIPGTVAWALIAALIAAAAATAVIVVFILLKRAVPAWLPEAVRQRIGAFQTGMLPDRGEIAPVLLLTIAIWSMESLWIYFLALGFNVNLGLGEAVFLTMIPVIASVFPFTPSGAGAVELTLFSCLRLVGMASPLAVSLTVVNRFIDFWLHIVLGAFTWMIRGKIGLRTWRDSPSLVIGDPDALPTPVRKENTV